MQSTRLRYSAPKNHHFFNKKAKLFILEIKIPTNIPNEMRYAALVRPELRNFFHEKYKWTNKRIEDIDWEIHIKAVSRQKPMSQKTIIQFIHRWLQTHSHPGTETDITTKCPCCHHEDETNNYFLSCASSQIVKE